MAPPLPKVFPAFAVAVKRCSDFSIVLDECLFALSSFLLRASFACLFVGRPLYRSTLSEKASPHCSGSDTLFRHIYLLVPPMLEAFVS